MSIGKEYSIVADSTVSSSPQLTPDASALVKRPLRTYGRRREEPPTEDAGISVAFLGSIHGNGDSIHCTAPPGLSEEVPPSSPRTNPPGRGDTNDDEAPGSTKFNYAWRTKLMDLDEDEDDLPEENDPPTTSLSGQPNLLHVAAGKSTDPSLRTKPPVLQPPPSASDDVFCSHALDSPPQIVSAKPSFVLSSPAVGPTRNSRVIQDSDSEPEALKDSSSTTPSSSSQLQNLISPKSPSLSTPPTSEDDMPANILTKPRSTGRRKPLSASRGSVPPLEFSEGQSSEVIRPSATKHKSRKPKAPTKKDMTEIVKERGRLAAQTTVSIPRNEKSSKYTVKSFFAKIQEGHTKQLELVSDPIEPFSSPLDNNRSATTQRTSHIPELPEDSDGDDFPPVSEIMEKSRRKDLQDMKQKLMHTKKAPVDLSDDDDDLEIVPRSPNKMALVEQRKNPKEWRTSEGRKRQMHLAQVRTAKAAVPIIGPSQHSLASIISQQATTRVDQVVLNRIMAAEVRKEAQQATKRKEEAWQKHGGHLRARPEVQPEGLSIAVDSLAEKVRRAAELNAAHKMDVEDDDEAEGSDEDWGSDFKGSDSPEPAQQEAGDQEEEDDEKTPMDEDTLLVVEELLDDDEDGKVRTSTSRRMIVQSDSEDEIDENVPVKPQALQGYRRSTSSSELYTEGEQDKENDTALMYDGTEDKENQALARRQSLSNSSRSIFDVPEVRSPSLSPTFPSREWNARNRDIQLESEGVREQRSPLKELISEESPSSLRSSTLTQSFAAKLQQASPSHGMLTPTPTLKPFLVGREGSNGFDGFSQFSQREPDVFGAAPLQPGFSDLFEDTTEGRKSSVKADRGGRLSDAGEAIISEQRIPQRTVNLELTQDVTSALNLQPAFQVQDGLIRKADAIFEKEQAFVLEAAKKKPDKAGSALYVNDHGFLTQTRPEDGSPEIYRPSPSQSLYSGDSFRAPLTSPLQPRPRAPLRTLSISSSFRQPDSPEQVPLRRLRKAVTPPIGLRSISHPAITPPRKRNAFEMLARGATKAEKRAHGQPKGVDLSAFLENEAAESDDENTFGFAKPRDDDEEDGEDLDKTLDVLMDDKEMDEATVAAELVHEKFMEQAEEADQKLEKIHMAVVQGEHRKRQRGVGVDDSDEESEDGDNSKARRAMKKLKMIERGDIKDLGANEATRAFADAYKQTLRDDDQEFSYLVNQSESNDVLGGRNILTEWEGEQDEDDELEEETISHQELVRQIRQRKEEAIEDVAMDPRDVSWLESGQQEESPQVKTFNSRRPPRRSLQDSEMSEMDGTMGPAFRTSAGQINDSSKQWLAQENRTRNAGTSRSVGGSAITGHKKAKSTISSRKGSLAQEPTFSTTGNKGVKSTPSMLSVITDKSRHFA